MVRISYRHIMITAILEVGPRAIGTRQDKQYLKMIATFQSLLRLLRFLAAPTQTPRTMTRMQPKMTAAASIRLLRFLAAPTQTPRTMTRMQPKMTAAASIRLLRFLAAPTQTPRTM